MRSDTTYLDALDRSDVLPRAAAEEADSGVVEPVAHDAEGTGSEPRVPPPAVGGRGVGFAGKADELPATQRRHEPVQRQAQQQPLPPPQRPPQHLHQRNQQQQHQQQKQQHQQQARRQRRRRLKSNGRYRFLPGEKVLVDNVECQLRYGGVVVGGGYAEPAFCIAARLAITDYALVFGAAPHVPFAVPNQ